MVTPMRIVPRADWMAEEPRSKDPLGSPIRKVSFHYQTGTEECKTEMECCRTVYAIQARHLEEGYPDIHYNFLIGNDGLVYEGRGWETKPEIANKYPACQDHTIEIAYIGSWETRPQPYPMYQTAMALCDYGVHHDLIHNSYTFIGRMEKEVDYSKLGGIPK